jgi:hypothetical protein
MLPNQLLLGIGLGVLLFGCKASNPVMEPIPVAPDSEPMTSSTATEPTPSEAVADLPTTNHKDDPVIARIGDKNIFASELLATWLFVDTQAMRELMGNVMDRHLVNLEAERLGIEVSDELVDGQFTGALEDMRAQLQAEQPGMRLDEWIAGALGLDPVRFRKRLRMDVKSRLLSERVVRHHILSQDNAEVAVIVTNTQAEAKEALMKIEGGEPFPRVAVEMSIDPTGKYGGRLPPLVRNESTLSRLAFGTTEGEIAGPVEEAQRWMLVQTLEKREALVGTWEALGGVVEASLKERPISEPEYWQWKETLNRLRPVDLSPFFDLIGEPKDEESL